ncbi:MAG: M48 family metallopeptidase [Pseudomonadota bacterium]
MSLFSDRAGPAIGALCAASLLAACASAPQHPAPVMVRPAPVEPTPVLNPKMAADAEALNRQAALLERVYQVAAPLLINNADLCKNHARNLLGFTAKNRHSYPGEFNDAAHNAFGMGERLQVSGVLAGSGAYAAGLRRGDALIAAEGKPLPTGANAETTAGSVFGPLVANHTTIKLTVSRDGAHNVIAVPVTRACGFRVEVGNADNVNAYADGSRIMVTRGMINIAQTDEELAYVMAKGLAHNILNHASSQRSAGTLASIIDNLVNLRPDLSMLIGSGGIKPMPGEVDASADTLAIYLLARAGYNVDHASRFWQNLAANYPASVLNGYVANHPATAIRVAAIDKAVAEVKSKQASKRPLVP